MKPIKLFIIASLALGYITLPTAIYGASRRPDLFAREGVTVSVRYTAYYRGDDDAIATCLIYSDNSGLIIGTGLTSYPKAQNFQLTTRQANRLAVELNKQRFELTRPESDDGELIATRGLPNIAVPSRRFSTHWEKAHPGLGLEVIVREICDIDMEN